MIHLLNIKKSGKVGERKEKEEIKREEKRYVAVKYLVYREAELMLTILS